MKNGWVEKKLSQICEKITDGTHQTPTYFDTGVVFLSSKNVTSGKIDWDNIKYIDSKQHIEMHKRVAPRTNDILLAKNGTTGVAAIVDRNVAFDIYVSLALLRPLDVIYPPFLLFFINSPLAKEQFNKRLKGVGVPNLHLEEIREVIISHPPLPEQKRIVAILDEAFSGISRAKEIAEKNLANTKKIFLNRLDSIFFDSERTWTDTTLEKILNEQPRNGWSPPSANHSETGTPVLTLSSVTGFEFKPEKVKFTSAVSDKKRHYWVRNGDLLITRSNTPTLVGHVAIANGIEEATIYPDLIMKMNVDPKKALTVFVYYQLRTTKLRDIIMGRAQGANPTMKKICKKAVQTLPIRITTISEQMKIVEVLNAIITETKKLEFVYHKKILALDELKKSILQKAFSGELTGTAS